MKIAVAVGASSGLGREFVFLLDTVGMDEIWVTARRKERLLALQKQVQTNVRVFAGDICHEDTIQSIQTALQQEQPEIAYFIYAAGLGRIGETAEISAADVRQMIRVNCEGAAVMTSLCLPYMKKGSHIAEICSVAAFQPIPYLNVYAATKAFLYRYSLALAAELKPKGITVTAVCPYWVKDTEFISIASQTNRGSHFCRYPFAATAQKTAKRAWRDIQKGRMVSTPGWVAWWERLVAACTPVKVMMWFCRYL